MEATTEVLANKLTYLDRRGKTAYPPRKQPQSGVTKLPPLKPNIAGQLMSKDKSKYAENVNFYLSKHLRPDQGKLLTTRIQPKTVSKLFCIMDMIKQVPPDMEEMKKKERLREKVKERLIYLRKLHQMHQLAMLHDATTKRLLDRRSDDWDMTFVASPMLSFVAPPREEESPTQETSESQEKKLPPTMNEDCVKESNERDNIQVDNSRNNEEFSTHQNTMTLEIPPISLQQVAEACKVKVPHNKMV